MIDGNPNIIHKEIHDNGDIFAQTIQFFDPTMEHPSWAVPNE